MFDRFEMQDQQYEGPDIRVLHDKIRIARRDHTRECSWCHKPVQKGESYIDVAFTEDGKFKHEKYHASHRYGEE